MIAIKSIINITVTMNQKPIRIKLSYTSSKTYPFLRSSKTLSMYDEFPILFSQNRNTLSSLETCASSGRVSRKDICFVWVESPFLHMKLTITVSNMSKQVSIQKKLNTIRKSYKLLNMGVLA